MDKRCCKCSECKKTKERSPEEYKKLMNRLGEDIGAAVDAFNRELLENHISTCVVNNIREGNDEVVGELISIIKRLM